MNIIGHDYNMISRSTQPATISMTFYSRYVYKVYMVAVVYHCVYVFTGLGAIEKILRGKGVIMVLVLLFAVAMAPWFMMKYQAPGCEPQSERKPVLPNIPTAFTGRRNEIQKLIDYVVIEHISIVAVTGGPARAARPVRPVRPRPDHFLDRS